MTEAESEERDVARFLLREGLAQPDDAIGFERLAGGVSSDIWKISAGSNVLCVKRALLRLRVAREWEAPVSRNASEWAWLKFVSGVLPHAVPKLYAHDAAAGLFAMEFFEPESYPVWKAMLRDGNVAHETAVEVGSRLARIHSVAAGDSEIARRFATDESFYALRLKPYLIDTAERQPRVAARLRELAERTASTKRTLVHGDVSPKNILVGPHGPIFLDAECAWYGDPAFDLAFVLNHMLLKCVWRPAHRAAYGEAFTSLAESYFKSVAWEPRDDLEQRVASLLPALTLARIDGTSPVEYITDDVEKNAVRAIAVRLIEANPSRVDDVRAAWHREFAGSPA